jgi:hypothetical protein
MKLCTHCKQEIVPGAHVVTVQQGVQDQNWKPETTKLVGGYHSRCYARSTVNPEYVLKTVFGFTQKELKSVKAAKDK